MVNALTTPVHTIKFIGPVYAKRLEKLNIFTVDDLLHHYPFRYEDYSRITPIRSVRLSQIATIRGNVQKISNAFTKRGKIIQKATIADDTGNIDVIWFNQPYLLQSIQAGAQISLSGKVEFFGSSICLISPEHELITPSHRRTIHTGRIVPVYPETYGVSSKWLRSRIAPLLEEYLPQIQDFLPNQVIAKQHLLCLEEALESIHFPDSFEKQSAANKRLSFDELFVIQLANQQQRLRWKKQQTGLHFAVNPYTKDIDLLYTSLPFTLTNAQQKAISEISADLAGTTPMNRMLEGDVGSGKTVVAAVAAYIAYLNGYQTAFMAPTEILAMQHYESISKLLSPLGMNIDLRTGSIKPVKKNTKQINIEGTDEKPVNCLIGTHALLSESVQFEKLGLIIIDEQHRFGVEQRAILKQKGINPHVLTMTATPIPRTVALTLYGDLDCSILDEMPKGRTRVKTWIVPDTKRQAAYEWLKKLIHEGHDQVFIVCPLIDTSETSTSSKAALKEFEHLSKKVFPEFKLDLIHGRMKSTQKSEVLRKFKEGETQILVATPVVEVGIDIPNATVMLIEGAERFGLAQLHQLRGRVGRGNKESYCLLFSGTPQPEENQRLKAMETIYVGSKLAEMDLRIRGAGNIYGTQQHGNVRLKIADLSDLTLIQATKSESISLLQEDENLKQFPLLQEKVNLYTIKNITPN